MRLHKTLESWIEARGLIVGSGQTIGFVPTMGALHEGHLSLLRKARAENDVVLLSIFVNPTQFDNPEDLAKYPSTLEQDCDLAEANGCDHIITPNKDMMYPDGYRYRVTESEFSKKLCGAYRPGHFDGVLSVVLKLFNIAKSTRAYFGEKDFQQLELVREMARAFFLDVDVIGCPTLRETDGLAMSSRNVRLSPSDRERAPLFAKVLRDSLLQNKSAEAARAELEALGFRVDYIEDAMVGNPFENRRFGAVFLGNVRLIDNMTVRSAKLLSGGR
jgi:pantoate--beta-alanine ligase